MRIINSDFVFDLIYGNRIEIPESEIEMKYMLADLEYLYEKFNHIDTCKDFIFNVRTYIMILEDKLNI